MPNMTSFDRGDVVLIPFPFSDQSASKIRPAIVANPRYSSDDLLVVGGDSLRAGEFFIESWKKIGLLHPSYVKRALATVEADLIRRRIGRIETPDLLKLNEALRLWFGLT